MLLPVIRLLLARCLTKDPKQQPREIAARALAAVTVLALGYALTQPGPDPVASAPTKSDKLSPPIEGAPDLRYTRSGVAISPDGTRMAYVGRGQLYIQRLDDLG